MSLQDALAITERIVVGFEALNNLNEVLIVAVNLEEDCRLLSEKKAKLQTDILTLQKEKEETILKVKTLSNQTQTDFTKQANLYEQQINELQTTIQTLESKKNTLDRDITQKEKQREKEFLLELNLKEKTLKEKVLNVQRELQQAEQKLEQTMVALAEIKTKI